MSKLTKEAKKICENCRKKPNSYKKERSFIEHWNKYCGVVEIFGHEIEVFKHFQNNLIYAKTRGME